MNTLKSGTVIVVLLGVLYGVYIVLSKPDGIRSLQPGRSSEVVKGPEIDFGGTQTTSAEPQLAVETGGSSLGIGLDTGSPASLGSSTPPSSPAPSSYGSMGASGSSYGQGGSSNSFGSPSSGPSPSSSAYGAGNAAGGPSGYGAENNSAYGGTNAGTSPAGGYGSNTTPGSTAPSGNAYGNGAYAGTAASNAGPASQPPVQTAYGTAPSPGGANGIVPTSLTDTGAEVRSDALTEYSLRQMWSQAEQLVASNKLKEALKLLSTHYSNPSLPAEHREAIVGWLDPLAAKVIYSREHILELPYRTRAKETLFDVEERFNVPWQLLHNINREVVSDPQLVIVGTELKVVQGPFRAEVHLSRNELTLYLGDLYAGRFGFTLGNEPPQPGSYKVVDKRRDRVYYGADGTTIPAGDPNNPYGDIWLDLGREVSIHGSPAQASGTTLGCISLSPQDSRDVYGILSLGSEVVIR